MRDRTLDGFLLLDTGFVSHKETTSFCLISPAHLSQIAFFEIWDNLEQLPRPRSPNYPHSSLEIISQRVTEFTINSTLREHDSTQNSPTAIRTSPWLMNQQIEISDLEIYSIIRWYKKWPVWPLWRLRVPGGVWTSCPGAGPGLCWGLRGQSYRRDPRDAPHPRPGPRPEQGRQVQLIN